VLTTPIGVDKAATAVVYASAARLQRVSVSLREVPAVVREMAGDRSAAAAWTEQLAGALPIAVPDFFDHMQGLAVLVESRVLS
jgi:hypothetical protein